MALAPITFSPKQPDPGSAADVLASLTTVGGAGRVTLHSFVPLPGNNENMASWGTIIANASGFPSLYRLWQFNAGWFGTAGFVFAVQPAQIIADPRAQSGLPDVDIFVDDGAAFDDARIQVQADPAISIDWTLRAFVELLP